MKYLVIGMGNFGNTLACKLTDLGHDVIGVDINEHHIEDIKDRISIAYIMDATDKAALRSLPLDDIDYAVVAIGQSMESSLRATAALKELGVSDVFVRAIDLTHHSILRAMGIQKIFIPESLAASLLAEKLIAKDFTDLL